MSLAIVGLMCRERVMQLGHLNLVMHADHKACSGGETREGVLGGWICTCACHRGRRRTNCFRASRPGRMNMFGIVEIMGHRTRAGRLSDVTIGGATMLRIEHPSRAATFDNNEPETELYAPAAIFAIRLCTEDEARAAAEYSWPPRRSVNQAALASPFDELVEDDDFDDDMDLYERTER